jgi:hypothetical protein
MKAHKKVANSSKKQTLFSRIDTFFHTHAQSSIFVLILVNVLLTLLFFDPKVSLSGDDADYIIYAYHFVEDFSWPGFRGALYPILLSPFIALFGIRLILLKLLSAACIWLMLYFLYKAFHTRIPASVLFFTIALLSLNSYLLFYESQTFSEALFMLLQTLFLLFFFKYFITGLAIPPPVPESKYIKYYLLIAFLSLLVTLTRTVGYISAAVIIIYFLIHKQWKKSLYSFSALAICFGLFNFLKKLIWPDSGSSYALSSYFAKDMYNPSKGMETLAGFVTRFIKNAEGYLSRDLAKFMGLRAENILAAEVSTTLTVIFIVLFIYALWIIRKNKPLLFSGLYTFMLCSTHFILLQANWQQERFMLVLYPTVLLILMGGLYYLLQPYRKWQFLLPLFAAVLFFGTLTHTFLKLERHIPVLRHNLQYDPLYGYTPDWRNFILMSKWAARNIPPSEVIVSRKPSISCIHGNRDFLGIFSVPAIEKSELIKMTPYDLHKILLTNISSLQIQALSPYMQYVVFGTQTLNGEEISSLAVYEIPENEIPQLLPVLKENNIAYTFDPAPVFEHLAGNNEVLCYSPDALYNNLRERNIRYMIMASLRIYPAKPTGDIVNTLHRYIYIVSLKYPHIVKQTRHTIGDSEPASLIELQY